MKNRCSICHNDAGDYRICPSCYQANFAPCPDCGKPTAQISKFGKPTRGTCTACTTRNNAHTRRIGKTCLSCGNRFQSDKKANAKSVCDRCMKITVPCPQCDKPMLKYKEKGGERKYCSFSCNVKSFSPLARSTAAKKANKTKWAGHVYKSHQNRLARDKAEYKEWRESVYRRDNYTCQDCGARNHKGNGKTIEMHPHHIKPFAEYPALRYDVSNGVTLCKDCHKKRHSHVFIGKTKKSQPSI